MIYLKIPLISRAKNFILFCFLLLIAGASCGEKDQNQSINDAPVACTGFEVADANIFVRSSLNDEILLSNATVRVLLEDSEQGLVADNVAEFIAVDDNSDNTSTGAYYSLFNINSSDFTVGVIVSADGYHTAVMKNIEFSVDSSCGAKNDLVLNVYLCLVGSSCL